MASSNVSSKLSRTRFVHSSSTGKLVLATTKDRDHRLYLGEGIYAEVTLHYQGGAWRARPWTYPDCARGDYHEFFLRCREHLRGRQR